MTENSKYVVVTGAAGGMGQAVVTELMKAGYGVLAADRSETYPQVAYSCLPEEAKDRFLYRQLDVSSEEEVENFARYVREKILERGITLHGAVTCAGVVLSKSLLETSLSEWRSVHAVNADGVFLTLREVAKLMVEQNPHDSSNERSLVVISSNAATTPRAEFGAYGASKASALRVASSFGLQLAAHGIRVNTLCPGTTRTPMVTGSWQGKDLSSQPIAGNPETYRLGIPLGRIAEPTDISPVVNFLLSPEARHITMQELTVDGGATF